MKERAVIIFIAVLLGLLLTTIIFFIYQSTKVLPKEDVKNTEKKEAVPTPTPISGTYLTIESPKDEAVTDKRTVEVKGRTNPGNTIIVSTNQEDVVAKPTTQGNFSVTITIDAGTNALVSRAITPQGEEVMDERIVSFSTEDF